MLCKKSLVFCCFWEPLGLPVATFLGILGPCWAPSGSPEIQKLITMLAKTRISKNPLQIRRESTENYQEPAANPPRFCREPPRTCREPAVRTPNKSKLKIGVSMEDSLLRQTLQQKRLESKVGRRCSPLGGLQLNKKGFADLWLPSGPPAVTESRAKVVTLVTLRCGGF